MNFQELSYSELKAWAKEEIAKIDSNPFGYYHMKSKVELANELQSYYDKVYTKNNVAQESSSVVSQNNSGLQSVITLLQQAMDTLHSYVEKECDCEKENYLKQIESLQRLAFSIQAELG